MYLLSIVIPTFNRCQSLRKTLDQIANQISPERKSQIELVLSDNASSDETKKIVSEWRRRNKKINFSYFCNKTNLGFDRNCLSGAKRASGKFVWFMSDDDSLSDGAVDKVFNALMSNRDVVFAFVNYSMMTPGFDEYFPCKFKEDVNVSADDLIIMTKFYFSFISSCIFNREILCSIDLTKHLGSDWIQLYAVKIIAPMGKSLIISEPLVKMQRPGLQESRNEKKSADKAIDYFMQVHFSFLDYLNTFNESNYSKKTLRFIKNLGWNDNLNQIISLKLTSDSYNFNQIKLVFLGMEKHFSHKISFWCVHLPMLILPRSVSVIYFYIKLKYINLKKFFKQLLINLKVL
jgi:glycosyltransferase involved in cell wall biosynthesis